MKSIIKIPEAILLICLIHSCCKDEDNIIKDAEGNVYTSVIIGTQTWMVENLKTTRYNDGDLIGSTPTEFTMIPDEPTSKYHWPGIGVDSGYVSDFGRLYTWYAVMDDRKVCPAGWHLPSDEEWTTLIDFAGGTSVAGNKLKEAGFENWRPSHDGGGTNETGFTGRGGGYHDFLTDYAITTQVNQMGRWWSSSECSTAGASMFKLDWGNPSAGVACGMKKRTGLSVRCLKD